MLTCLSSNSTFTILDLVSTDNSLIPDNLLSHILISFPQASQFIFGTENVVVVIENNGKKVKKLIQIAMRCSQ